MAIGRVPNLLELCVHNLRDPCANVGSTASSLPRRQGGEVTLFDLALISSAFTNHVDCDSLPIFFNSFVRKQEPWDFAYCTKASA